MLPDTDHPRGKILLRRRSVTDAVPDEATKGAAKRRPLIITAIGLAQILAWGSSYYLLAVLAKPIVEDTGWPLSWVVGGLSIGLLTAAAVSPWVGRQIERRGGRPVLAFSSLLLASGLICLALSASVIAYLSAWILIGVGMGAGLYDPAFATLGRLYGVKARGAITMLTLFGGFASTACWPLSAWFVSELGWRGACFVYAALQLSIALPLYWFALPKEETRHGGRGAPVPARIDASQPRLPAGGRFLLLAFLASTITLSAMISTVLSVHLLTMLQARGFTLGAAVALGALVGPCQVGARSIEMMIGRRHHPIWTKIVSTALVVAGLATFYSGLPLVAVALVLYGAGIGLESIARGTLPLTLFGADGYATLMGRLAMPSLIAQAASPSIGAILMEGLGPDGASGALLAAAAVNFVIAAGLFVLVGWRSAASQEVR